MAEPLRVLILEDSPTDAELIQFELQDAGITFTARVVKTEEDFVRALQEFSPDLILSDYNLPQYDCARALAEARRRCPDTPFIMVTGTIREERAVEILTQGARDYVLKSHLEQRLVPAVRRALAEAEEHRARKRAEEELRESNRTLEERVQRRTAELQAEMAARKKMEETLRESEERLRLLADNLPDSAVYQYTHEPDGGVRFLYLSAGIKQLNGVTVEQVLQDAGALHRQIPPEYFTKLSEAEMRSAFDLSDFDMEVPMLRPDGQLRWMQLHSRPRRLYDGRVVWDGVQADVTNRKKVEEELQKSEERFRRYFDLGLIGMAVTTPDKGMAEVNEKLCEMFGYEKSELLRKTWAELTHPDDVDADISQFNRVLAGEMDGYSIDKRFIRKNGDIIDTIISVKCIRTTDGAVDYFLALIQDITERKRAEEAMRNRERLFQDVIDASTSPVFLKDLDGKFITVNKSAEKILGMSQGKIKGKTSYDIAPKEAADGWKVHDDEVMATGKAIQVEEVADLRDGQHIFLADKFPLVDADGQMYGIGGISHDITERKLAEQELTKKALQLEETIKELDSFSYSVSHDLQAPLRAIDGFSRKLEREYGNKLDAKFNHTVSIIRNNTKLMGALINDLLSFSRVQKTRISVTDVEMDKLADEVWHELREANQERDLTLNVSTILPAHGDRALIRQVLLNLLSNAVKFTKNRKQAVIEIDSYRDSGKTVYCLKDNGAGFDMEYADKLFGVFQRLHSADEYEGTGVGLAIVQRIVKRHGGEVWAEGEVDKGATFYFSLPCPQKETAAEY